MVKRCIFPPLSPIANGGNGSWSAHSTSPAGNRLFDRIPHLPAPTAAEVAAHTARTAALRQREARLCGWLARLLWLSLHVVVIAIACAANPLVAARLQHDVPYTLGLAFILAVNVALYVSLCALDPGFIPRDPYQMGSRKHSKQETDTCTIIQLSPWKLPVEVMSHNPPAESLRVDRIPGHICCSANPDGGGAAALSYSVSPSKRSGYLDPPLPPPLLLLPPPYDQDLVSPNTCCGLESQQGQAVQSGHIQQQYQNPYGSCGVAASLGLSADDTAHLEASPASHQAVQARHMSPASFSRKGPFASLTAAVPGNRDPEQQSLLSSPGQTPPAAVEADGGGYVGWCEFCAVGQPLSAKHCHDCGRCVLEFDHHCAWLGTCVGARNRCRFWWFLVVQTAVLGWGTAETAVAVPRQGFGIHVAHPLRALLLLWATFTCCLLMIVTAGLLVFNLYLGAKGLTMYQYMRLGGRQEENAAAAAAAEVAESMEAKSCVSDTFRNLRRFCCPGAS